jgi:hypothetical protein
MPLADPDVESVFAKIRNVRKEICRIVMHGFTGQQPPNMGPEAALAWRVRGMAALVGDEENREYGPYSGIDVHPYRKESNSLDSGAVGVGIPIPPSPSRGASIL